MYDWSLSYTLLVMIYIIPVKPDEIRAEPNFVCGGKREWSPTGLNLEKLAKVGALTFCGSGLGVNGEMASEHLAEILCSDCCSRMSRNRCDVRN